MLGARLEVQMSKKCTPLWCEAHFEVKVWKADHVPTHCWTFQPHDTTRHDTRQDDTTTATTTTTRTIRSTRVISNNSNNNNNSYSYCPTTTTTTTLRYTTPTQHYTRPHCTALHYTTLHSIALTLHYTTIRHTTLHNTNYTIQLQLKLPLQLQLQLLQQRLQYNDNYNTLHHATSSSCGCGDHCNQSKKTTPTIFRSFSGVRSAIHGITTTRLSYSFLSLKFPPPPCAVLLVIREGNITHTILETRSYLFGGCYDGESISVRKTAPMKLWNWW